MKDSKYINPLVNPVHAGEQVMVNNTIFNVCDGMQGFIIRDKDGKFLAQLPHDQIALCAWLHRQE